MPARKRSRLGPVFTEKELGQIVEEWGSMASWEASKPGQPSEEFRKRLSAYLSRPVRGRPQRQSQDASEKAISEWKLRKNGYTYEQIREKLYPHADYRMEDQIRKRVNRLQKLLGV